MMAELDRVKMVSSGRLMEQIAAPENLLSAWRSVRGNIPGYRRMRSSGPDGVTLDEFERQLPAQIDALHDALLGGRYEPHPPSAFKIRKPGGGERRLAVLNVSDRVAQRAAQQVLEPLWEPSFLSCSFGYRAGLSTRHAAERVRSLRGSGSAWLVDGDIAACFDNLNHDLLLKQVDKRVRDGRVIDLLARWLAVGILGQGSSVATTNPLEEGWQRTTESMKRGAGWVASTLIGLEDEYPAQEYSPYPYDPRELPGTYVPEDDDYLEGLSRGRAPAYPTARRGAMRRVVTSSLMLGASWMRPVLQQLGASALAALKTPAGRILLKRGVIAGGGAVGAALGVGAAAMLLYRELAPTPTGVLQGSPLSPLLANIYLHPFDAHMTRAGYQLVRFADDWVVCCQSEEVAERAYNQAVIGLARIKLKLNAEKTHIIPPNEPTRWLGEAIPPAGSRLSGRI